MSDILEFVLKMKDMMSNPLREVAAVAQRSFGTAQNAATSMGTRATMAVNQMAMRTRVMSHSVDELRNRLERVNQVRFGTVLRSEFRAATREARDLERQIDRLQNSGGGRSGGSMLGSFVGGNLISGAIMQGLSILKNQAVDTYQVAMKNSGLTTAINSTTGGQGSAAIAQTKQISNKYGLNYEASLEGVKTLTGGLMGMNMPLKEQMEIFEGVSTGIAAMKLGAEESKGAMLALGQMASKGTVSAEELRGQLGERIPGAFTIAARSMNMTEEQLGKMMQKGDIAAKDFLPRFAAEMQKSFGAKALEAAKGPEAIRERFNNSIYEIKTAIGGGLVSVISPIFESMTNMANSMLPSIKSGVDSIVSAFTGIGETTGGWSDYLAIARDHLSHFWTTLKHVASNTWGIVSGIAEWVGKSQILKDVFSVIAWSGNKVLGIISWVSDKLKWLWDNVLRPILDAIENAYKWVKDLMGGDNTIEVKVTTPSPKSPLLNDDYKSDNPYLATGKFQKASGNGGGGGNTKADGISSGGPRVININIDKLISGLNITSMNVREGVGEMGRMIQEEVRRVLISAAAAQ